MLSAKKILFPTHFLEFSEKVFQYAIQVAEAFEADIELLHVYTNTFEVSVPSVGRFQVQKEEEERVQKQMESFIERNVPKDFKGKVNTNIVTGFVRDGIIDFCNNKGDIDLIVLGTRGNYSLSKAIWSDRVAYILEKAQPPVLVVPEGGEFKFAKTIACATMPDQGETVQQVLSLAKGFDAKVYIVAIKGISSASDLSKTLDTNIYDNVEFSEIEAGAGVAGILKFIEQHNVDLLVMHAPYRNRLSRLIRYSKAQKLAIATKIPMLVFK
ncbi:MAG: universal stress protein [Aureispira sp.]|nr:universal stress protein [Aureispira sp.]